MSKNDDKNDDDLSPSHQRRQALRQADAANSLRVLDSYPLSKYVDIAQRLLDAFQGAVDERQLDLAYVYGLRFANLCIESLPHHPEWKMSNNQSKTSMNKKQRLAQQVDRVLHIMETIKQRMDAEELKRLQVERRHREELERAVHEQKHREQAVKTRQLQALEDQRKQVQEEEHRRADMASIPTTKPTNTRKLSKTKVEAPEKNMEAIEQSAMAKLLALLPPSFKKDDSTAGINISSPTEGTNAKEASEYERQSSLQKQHQLQSKGQSAKPGISRANVQPTEPKSTATKQWSRKQIESKTDSHSIAPNKQSPQSVTDDDTTIVDNKRKSHADVPSSTAMKPQQKQHRQPLPSSSLTQTHSSRSRKEESKDGASTIISTTEPTTTTTPEATSTNPKPTQAAATSNARSTSPHSSPLKIRMFASPEGTVEAVDIATTTIPPPEMTSSTKSTPYSRNSSSSSNVTNQSPLSCKEQKTISLLEQTIALQEQRLIDIETVQIPALLQQAKAHLRNISQRSMSTNGKDCGDKKKRALECVAKKRTLERQVDVIKAAIFNMETQMFMLENAMEDRHVQKALDEASYVMKNMRVGTEGAVDTNSYISGLDLLNLGTMVLPVMEEVDDDELMEELQYWLSPVSQTTKAKDAKLRDDDLASILSLPKVPASGLSLASAPESMIGLKNAVMG